MARIAFFIAFLVALGIAPRALAQSEPSSFRLRATVAGGVVVSADQRTLLDLDLPLVEARVIGGWVLHEAITLELALGGGAFFSGQDAPGGLVDAAIGAELGANVGAARVYFDLQLGVGITGDLVRPTFRASLGADLRASAEWTVGPVLAYGHVFEEDAPTRSDDAQYLELGLSITFRAVSSPPPPPPPPRRIARRPPRPPAPAQPAAPEESILTLVHRAIGAEPRELLVPVLFEYDSTAIVACSISALHALREHLDEHPSIRVLEIEGHADARGSTEHNAQLSRARAEAIRDWLVAHGIAPARLTIAARGEDEPIETSEDDASLQQNRRARFRVIEEDPQ